MQMAEHAVRGVAYHPRDRALQPASWSMHAAGSAAKEREMSTHSQYQAY